jgi:transcriptional regulator with XRE-family HTH domain
MVFLVADLASRLGSVIRNRRQAVGLSQDALAALCGVSRGYLGQIERGEASITITLMDRLAKGLNATLLDLIQEIDKDAG